jgi:hypothetical protein
MHPDLSFLIAMDGNPYPVRFDPSVLDEFQRDHVDTMDLELRKFSDEWFGPSFFLDRENRLGVIAPLIRDALEENNGILVAKYVLWLAARYPEITGIRIQQDTYEFMAELFDDSFSESHMIH